MICSNDMQQGHCFQFVRIFKVLKSIEFGRVLLLVIMKYATFFLSFFSVTPKHSVKHNRK